MTDDLDLTSVRPDPRPEGSVAEQHREQLLSAISGAGDRPGGASGVPVAGAPETAATGTERSYGTVRPDPASPRRRFAALVAAAAVVLAGAGVWVASGDDGSNVATAPTTADDAGRSDGASTPSSVTDPPPPPPPDCGTQIPASLQVPGALDGPVVVAAATAEPPAESHQLILRWTRAEGSVEVRWPAGRQLDYDLGEPRPATEPSRGVDGTRMELWLEYESDESGNNPPADLLVDTTGQAPPAEACTIMDVRVTGPDGTVNTGVDLRDLGDWVELGPLVIDREEVDEVPTDAADCDELADRREDVTMEPGSAPVAALRTFLATPEADGLGDSGFTELRAEDGTVTYGMPADGGDEFVVLISVVPVDGGWAVDHWTSSGC
jgi:hypothetical protein